MTTPIIAQLNPGGAQTLLLESDGTVWAWGDNVGGQLGTGMPGDPGLLAQPNGFEYPPLTTYSSVPTQVVLPPIEQVAGGAEFSIALAVGGTSLYAWGDNSVGELGLGPYTTAPAYSTTPVLVDLDLPPGVTITSIAGGLNTAYALLSTGQVMAWGSNSHRQAGQNTDNNIYEPRVIPGLSDVTAISAGDRDAVALESDGTVWAWGNNKYGQLGQSGPRDGQTAKPLQIKDLPPIALIASGGNDNIAVDTSGNVYTWGRNEFGELGRGDIDPRNAAHPTPLLVPGLTDIVSVDGEGPTTLAADASGNVYAFGDNAYGQVGDSNRIDTGTPTQVLTIPTSPDAAGPSVQVAAGHYFSFAFNAVTGETYAWGQNTSGQLGIPRDFASQTTPIDISGVIPPLPGAAPVMVFLASGMQAGSPDDAMQSLGAFLTAADLNQMAGDLLPASGGSPGTPETGIAGGYADWLSGIGQAAGSLLPPQNPWPNTITGGPQ